MTAAEWLARAHAVTDESWPDATVIAETKVYLPAAVAAIEAVLALHRACTERGGLISWTYCSCGTTSVTTRIDGHPSIAPVAYEDCPTVRAITAALDPS